MEGLIASTAVNKAGLATLCALSMGDGRSGLIVHVQQLVGLMEYTLGTDGHHPPLMIHE